MVVVVVVAVVIVVVVAECFGVVSSDGTPIGFSCVVFDGSGSSVINKRFHTSALFKENSVIGHRVVLLLTIKYIVDFPIFTILINYLYFHLHIVEISDYF